MFDLGFPEKKLVVSVSAVVCCFGSLKSFQQIAYWIEDITVIAVMNSVCRRSPTRSRVTYQTNESATECVDTDKFCLLLLP